MEGKINSQEFSRTAEVWYVFNFLFCFVSFRSTESSKHLSMSDFELHPKTKSEQDNVKDTDNLAPLNLSTKDKDNEKSQSDHRLRCSDTEILKENELPLNLSLRASHTSPIHSSVRSTTEDPDKEVDEEPCDQRQTAALALCQLSIASSAASSCDFSAVDEPLNSTDSSSPKNTKQTSRVKVTGIKRAKSGQDGSKCHRPNKRVKAPGRALRRRPRCC